LSDSLLIFNRQELGHILPKWLTNLANAINE